MESYTERHICEMFGQRLDSTSFTWEKYCGVVGVSVIAIFDYERAGNILNERFSCEGWCFANSLKVRPKSEGIAIMMYDQEEQEQVWCHISSDFFDTLYNLFKISVKTKKNNQYERKRCLQATRRVVWRNKKRKSF